MRHFVTNIAKPFSSTKVYYPALLSPNYDNIEYAPSYVNQRSLLSIKQHRDYKLRTKINSRYIMIHYQNS